MERFELSDAQAQAIVDMRLRALTGLEREKLEAEYAQLASEKAKFYEQYKEAKEELLKLKTAKQNVASFFREEEQTQQER